MSLVKPAGAELTMESQLILMVKAVGDGGSVGRLDPVLVTVPALLEPPIWSSSRDAPSSAYPNAYNVPSGPAIPPKLMPSPIDHEGESESLENQELLHVDVLHRYDPERATLHKSPARTDRGNELSPLLPDESNFPRQA